MTWLVWRQYRAGAAIAATLLGAFAALLLVTGLSMAAQWHSVLTSCTVADSCDRAEQNVYLGSPAMQVLVLLTMAVPAVFGMMWGAPLVAHETETGTRVYAWTQAVTRARWLAVKAGWTLLEAAVFGAAIAALVTWWSGPKNALYQNTFDPGIFDLQGIVPIGYALFATALGIAAGALLRRTLPALGVTLGGFVAVRLLINVFVREHFMAPLTAYHSPLASANLTGPAWVLATYQPASRFWAFQGIETGIFAALAAALVAVAFVVVSRKDA